ncbi:MAG: type IV pilus biogenesis/stability protein PilW [Arenimonas sp.]|uniref:type IV pilus biogenesis/stability protein PilW n=1 Tax=Arenimonas sp. TaxID=1872635 RepID=UPI0025C06D67|nr:type IV pilus biogenesis/stability protein PilW [Arenimonas sp.]MBW8368165.1 type IV pilus biogenesis/stability protein PilW [Arenimonas sp.]
MRHLCLAAAIALAAGCATGPGTSDPGAKQSAALHSAMSNKGQANLSLAQSYLASDRLEYAMDRANRALRSDPNSADVQVVLGMIREKLDDGARAGEHYARAAKLAPDTGHVLNVYAIWLCQEGNAAGADELFARAVKDVFYKNKELAYFNAAKCAQQVGQADKAAQYLRQGIELAPTNPALLERMAELQLQRGDYMSARAFYQRREAVGTPTAALVELGARIEDAAGDRAAAARHRQRLQDEFPVQEPTSPATEGSFQP